MSFRGSAFTHDSSDGRQRGIYECSEGVLSAQPSAGKLDGRYDSTSGVLTWAGKRYERIE